MANPYRVLGVAETAGDDEICARYDEMVRSSPPEHDPEAFRRLRAAYERIADRRARRRFFLFEPAQGESFDEWIEELTCEISKKRLGLNAIRAMLADR